MSFASDDLAQLFAAPQREHTGYGQGIIVTWNPETFENTISYRGSTLTNLPVMDRIGALTYKPGDVVLLMRWTPSGGGMSSYWIAGSPVIPGAGRAEQAIAMMSTDLGRSVAAAVFADRIHADFAADEVEINTTSWVSATGGPTVSGVNVSETGVALVTIGARLAVGTSLNQFEAGYMSFQVTGPTNVAPDFSRAIELSAIDLDASIAIGGTPSRQVVLTGLSPGVYSFSARYSADPNMAVFSDRSLSVIAL